MLLGLVCRCEENGVKQRNTSDSARWHLGRHDQALRVLQSPVGSVSSAASGELGSFSVKQGVNGVALSAM